MNSTNRGVLTALALMWGVGGGVAAQGLREVHSRGLREAHSWSTAGFSVLIGDPVGQFAEVVSTHPGFGASLTLGGPVGLRMAGGVLVYGHERAFLLYPGTGGRIATDINTDNIIVTAGLGPQITAGDGAVRMYAYGTLGFSYFATISSFDWGWAETTHYDDWALAREVGVGMQLRLASRRPVYLDVAARYLRNGRVRYLREGDLVEQPDGSLALWPRESHANLVVFQVGMSFALR